MLSEIQKTYSRYIEKPYLLWYLKAKRKYSFEGLKLVIYPGVFHPKYFFSTQVLLNFIKDLPLKNKSFCEPGSGSGLISMIAFKMGANVTCFDSNTIAVKGLKENFKNNFNDTRENAYHIYASDLFDNIPPQHFDVMAINPPYFFADASEPAQQAWYCGKNGEYFEKLFSQLRKFADQGTKCFMILGDNCEIERIQQIANKYQIVFNLVHNEKIKWENNSIFKLILAETK